MATLQQLEKRLIEADAAGQTEDVRILANEIRKRRTASQTETAEPISFTDRAKDAGMGAASGLAKGASYLAGFPGDLDEIGKTYLPSFMTTPVGELITGREQKEIPFFPSSEKIRDFAEKQVPAIKPVTQYQPQTNLGRYTQTAAEFATPGIAGKTSAARKIATGVGGAGGLLYQGLEDLTDSPFSASITTIPAMIALSSLLGPSRAAQLSAVATKGLSKEEIASGKALERAASSLNPRNPIKLNPAESLDNPMVTQLAEDVIKSDRGAPYIYEAAKNRPTAVSQVAENQAALLGQPNTSIKEPLSIIQSASKEGIKTAKRKRTISATEAGYKVANSETLQPEQVIKVINQIDNEIASLGTKSPNIKILKDLKTRISIPTKGGGFLPQTNINKLDSAFKEFRNKSDLPLESSQAIPIELKGKFFNADNNGILNNLNKELRTNNSYASANDKFAELSESLVSVVERNLQTLTKKGISINALNKAVFNPTSTGVDDIQVIFKSLNEVNKNAFPQIANTYFRNAINQAFKTKPKGDDLTQGFELFKQISLTGNQRKNFMKVLDGVAEAKNVNSKSLKVGFEKMINVFERLGRLQNLNKPGFDVQGQAAKTLAKDVAMMKTFNPLVRLATKYGELKAGGAMDVLGRVLASDQAIDNLIKLAKTNPQSKKEVLRVLNTVNFAQQASGQQASLE